MEEKAEIIRCRRFEEIINERYNLYDKQRLNESFIDYYEKEAKKHNQKWIYVCKHFKNYVNGKCSFGEVDVELCQGFAEYLFLVLLPKNTVKLFSATRLECKPI